MHAIDCLAATNRSPGYKAAEGSLPSHTVTNVLILHLCPILCPHVVTAVEDLVKDLISQAAISGNIFLNKCFSKPFIKDNNADTPHGPVEYAFHMQGHSETVR